MKLVLPQKKEQKPEPIPFETLGGLLRNKLDNLDAVYVEGCLDWVAEAHPELLREAQEAERRVDMVWLEALAGKATLRDYRGAVETWYRAYKKCFEAYNQKGNE